MRADRLQDRMASETNEAGEIVEMFVRSSEFLGFPLSSNVLNAMAWSEATSPTEVSYLLRYLVAEGLLRFSGEYFGEDGFLPFAGYEVTVTGHSRIADQEAKIVSSQAFVAMWFDDSVTGAYEEGIVPAIRASGFEPKRIDRDQSVDKIDDAIIAELKRSRFLIADFTHGKEAQEVVFTMKLDSPTAWVSPSYSPAARTR